LITQVRALGAKKEGIWNTETLAGVQFSLASALWQYGEQSGKNEPLAESIELYRKVLDEWTRERVPLQWATTQSNLGAALWSLGERESETKTLTKAVSAFREALKERTREHVPLQWATTQNNLGNALQSLGSRESGTETLAKAVDAFREALKERASSECRSNGPRHKTISAMRFRASANARAARSRSRRRLMQKAWGAREQSGDAQERGQRLSRGAEGIYPRARAARLGHDPEQSRNALKALGQRESGTETLTKAVDAYREALKEWTHDRVPLKWAGTQLNLALVYSSFFVKDAEPHQLDAALEAVDGALEEFRKANAAYDIEKAERLRQQILAAKGKL
jgi:tetratricopeptide (TPR) repeat protein